MKSRCGRRCSCAAALAALPATAGAGAHGSRPCRGGVLHPVGTPTAAFAAVVKRRRRAYRRPAGALLATFPKLNQNRLPDDLLDRRRDPQPRVRRDLVPRQAADAAERGRRLRAAGATSPSQKVTTRIVGRPVPARARLLPARQARPDDAGRGRLAVDADADRPLLRQPADLDPDESRAGPSARRRSASPRSRTSSRAGRRAGRSASTGRTSRGRSARRPRTAASASRTRRSQRLFAATPGGTPVVIHP